MWKRLQPTQGGFKVLNSKDRSCITRFLNNSPWDEEYLNSSRLKNLLNLVKPKANESIFIAIDDTVITKSKDTKHIEALGYHFSHTEGKASGIDNAVVLICYEANKENSKIVSILSTDTELSSKEILKYYSNRWEIETSFLYLKDRLGLKHYQMRKIKGFTRFWIVVYLAYTLLKLYRARESKEKFKLTLGDAIRSLKGATFRSLITCTYILTSLNINLFELYKIFGLTP